MRNLQRQSRAQREELRGTTEHLQHGKRLFVLAGDGSRANVEREPLSAEDLANLATRPRVRGDCRGGERPCPWLGCRHHLCLEVSPETGSIKLAYEDLELAPDTCSLDVAERGDEVTLEGCGVALNVTRERVRQIEKLAHQALFLGLRRRGFTKDDILAWIATRSERSVDWKETA